jgi:hypothetical protein
MKKFGSVELRLNKDVKTGDKESLLSLFDVDDRFKPIEVLEDAEDDSTVIVNLEELAEAELKLGADMFKGKKKTIMTLFWFVERNKAMEMKKDASRGEKVIVNIYKSID